ncbi:MAG: efflux RND transporter periplasmic adaptor subunit [Rhodopirellula sp. JB044]|uniref:efflux RND transporter periplasmic adaptor subunit n=1 Tax=Rhodopirellula sp. JB044 TaxID=3342844 RepID=UPI00370BC7B2
MPFFPHHRRNASPVLVALLAVLCLASARCEAQSSSQPLASPGQQVVADNCSVKYIRNVNIPAEVEGKLIELNVEEGMRIVQGDVLAVVDDTAATLALELKRAEETEAMLNADNDVNLKDARNSRELADAEAESHKKLYQEQAIPFWEMKKKELEAVRAALRIDLAEMQKKIALAQYVAKRNEREIAEYEKERRQIVAPFDGYVETRVAQSGEWVQPGSPIATIVQLDRVRVEGVVDAIAFSGRVRAGLPVTVRVFSSSDRDRPVVVQSKLGFVSSELNLRRQVRIWVDIDNVKDQNGAWIVKPGMQAEILFD